ncbi:hypothetical protein C0991_004915 [Blastosporella zonata]|nr:hypothetical protein C0991_004915 [Blastosporella zonata]
MVQHSGTPVGRSRHGKRLPQDSDDSGTLDGPVTLTVNEPPTSAIVTPTVTVSVQAAPSTQPTTTTVVDTNVESSPVVVTPTQSITSSNNVYGLNGYGNATNNEASGMGNSTEAAQTSSPTASTASSSGPPVGAIVGIVLVIVLLLAAGITFWFRRRFVANRLKIRQWTKQPTAPSFLWIEPKESAKITPFPVMSSNTPYRGTDLEANMTFGGPAKAPSVSEDLPTNNGLPYIPPPAPPRPPPAAGIYDLQSPAPVSMTLSPSAAVRGLVQRPVSPGIPTSPWLNKRAESAKVRSTFIPTLPDELSISTGEMVRIHSEFDDGWVLCSNARGEMGMAPLECLDKASEQPKPSNLQYRKSVRASSLRATTPKLAYTV